MPDEVMDLLERFVIAMERIADSLELEATGDEPVEPRAYLNGERIS